jgi:regulator of protease activity HflC (stomatin/prohibitin superfamily)
LAAPIDVKALGNKLFTTGRGRAVYFAVFAAIAIVVSYNSCTTYIGPNEYGIKQVVYGVGKGIKKEPYAAGLQWVTPGFERMHRFPTDVQALNLTSEDGVPNSRRADSRRAEPLNIQTSEGYNVRVDVSVLYRIADPYRVITTIGPGKLYEDAIVIPRSAQVLRKHLGALDAEEFYDVKKRHERVELAFKELDAELAPAGIEVQHVFIRDYVYDNRYQQAIEQRKIQDQSVFKNQAEADMASANAEKDRIVAVGDAAVRVELARGEAEKLKLEAEADLYERKQRAAGELQVKLAEAEGTRLENEALRGTGSEALVGLKMADVLKGTQVIVVPTDGPSGVNPLDLQSALKRFDVRN